MSSRVGGALRATEYSTPEHTTRHARSIRHSDPQRNYNLFMEKKIFWMIFVVLGLVADVVLPIWWGLLASIPICYFAWWVAYRSDWF
jgi:hypothetical protein